ncbi:glucose 1-dehydrogenase [Neobacillus sp. DY30]|uniref:SDR family NAD(P)-dependent oxidoreductase n=1 Tax=Neobacillus sp. DY30 TaxID=3047871 RepID=UPI0024BFABD1|nr:glucose 1-dehydrogenase [Neobacillus sp. DY30]WHY00485.1 glucose 1-dehydrogenase [Neobacillus sp. DY30]
MNDLTGKVALITGASQGIGAGIAKTMAKAGAKVIVNHLDSPVEAQKVVNDINNAGGQAIHIHADVTRADEIRAMFDEAEKNFGLVDVIVNNAGVYEFSKVEDLTTEKIRFQFDVNVTGLLLVIGEAVRRLGNHGGSIVNIGSTATQISETEKVVYTATKSAVDAVTRVLSKELGPRNIRVNSVNPGGTETEGGHKHGLIGSPYINDLVNRTPLGRLGQPEDIGLVATFLASEDARWLTGEVLLVSGGLRP